MCSKYFVWEAPWLSTWPAANRVGQEGCRVGGGLRSHFLNSKIWPVLVASTSLTVELSKRRAKMQLGNQPSYLDFYPCQSGQHYTKTQKLGQVICRAGHHWTLGLQAFPAVKQQVQFNTVEPSLGWVLAFWFFYLPPVFPVNKQVSAHGFSEWLERARQKEENED